MDLSLERDSTAIGSLFQQIIADMKNTSPLWEDFVAKASKLHACLRAAIQAIAAYLDAFQKIADAATNSRGASKEIGTALTRVCLRHKAVETRMKTFTSAIMDCLIVPLQDKLEDWKRQVVTIDKEHAKEYKRCRTELKKRSSDTLRLQKKARKGQSDTIQSLVDSHMQDVSMRRAELEDVERKSLRSAMIEERMRYCNFVYMLQPVVKEECEVMSELGHLQEAMQSIAIVTKEPNILPQSSEELILDSKSSLNLYPESPGGGSGSQGCSNSLGSRKSSVCSISSMNSSGSSGSPGHHYQRSLSQLISPAIRLKPGESSDSGFCSSPALTSQASGTTSQSHAVSTWPPHSQDVVQTTDRPHTISSAYEKGHQRPALTVYTFQNPETIIESQKSPAGMACRPPLPVRCSSLERPMSAAGIRNPNVNIIQRQCPSPIPAHITKELPQLQPTYVNMSELASMAASKITNQQLQQQQQQSVQQQSQKQQQSQQLNSPNQSTTSSQISSDSSIGNSHHLHSLSDLSLTGTAALSTASTATLGVTTPPSIGDSPPLTSQNNLPQLTENTNSLETKLTGSGNTVTNIDDELKITETDSTLNIISNTTSSNSGILSPENDDISRASVLQKTSMFEKLEQKQQIVNNNLPTMTTARSSHIINTECNFANKKEEIYKCTGTNEKDPDQIYEDSIQELNNLIGELDSFQREHELKELANRTKLQNPLIIDNLQSTIDTDSISDKISIGSLNYSTQSTNASEIKFNYSDSEISRYVSESSSVGFENPTFLHFNNHNGSSSDLTGSKSNCNGTDLIGYDQNTIIVPSDFEYVRENSEIVVLRCKDPPTAADRNETESNDSKQRLSSFRSEQQSSSSFINTVDQQNQYNQEAGTINRDESNLSKNNLKYVENSLNVETTPTMDHLNRFHHIKTNLDERLRSKPTISPRPASLSGCVSRITRRSSINSIKPPPPVRRSSSVTPSHNLTTPNSPNLIQQNVMNSSVESLPPPPAFLLDRAGNASPTINVAETVKALTVIRHTPASPSALRRSQVQQNPPPTIQSNTHTNNTASNTFQTLKNEVPVNSLYSPPTSIINTTNNCNDLSSSHRTSNSTPPGIYAQPKQVSKMSSFRTPSPGPQKTSSSLLAQLNARLMPSKQNQQQQQQHHPPPPNEYSIYQQNTYQENNRNNQSMNAQHMYGSGPNSPHHQTYTQPEQIYSRADDRYYYAAQQQQHNQQQQQQHQQQQQQQHQQHCDDYSPSNIEKSGSMRSKSKAEFLENLNAKLAKQGLSGRAFAVRNLINSKALPDPRLCHESLMDQIKRGATLKRNRTINDRSAPKIH